MRAFGISILLIALAAAALLIYLFAPISIISGNPSPGPTPEPINLTNVEASLDKIVEVQGNVLTEEIDTHRDILVLSQKIDNLNATPTPSPERKCKCSRRKRRCQKSCQRN